jgi:hypothetical protein
VVHTEGDIDVGFLGPWHGAGKEVKGQVCHGVDLGVAR